MATKIITKFIIGTEQGMNTLSALAATLAREQFAGKIPTQELEAHIDRNFNKTTLIAEVNSMSNQYLIVYADDEPAGFARVTTKGLRPELFNGKTLARIADFGILAQYTDPLIAKSLFEKCVSICSLQQLIWINEYEGNPYLAFFESYGFKKNTKINASNNLSLKPVYLVKEKI